ncbi:hypothetical protein H5410_014751 [Solanum commersonii]|uniref:Uncharacterized protein n=1 Tax=Solanum commersonii TaxID=4109 RepID=A0A9J5ZSE1_SOLCO|nr:hypothetical protein H5410_014751 [Solanum commersonii]
MLFGRRRLPDAHTPQLMRAWLGRCQLPLANSHKPRPAMADVTYHWPTSFAMCTHATSDACRPGLMSPAVCRRRLPDAHIPSPIRGPFAALDFVA